MTDLHVRSEVRAPVERSVRTEVARLLPRSRLAELDGAPHAMVHDAADALADVALPFLIEES
jgi:pimeloyl-ACP methyl ester carboxylesterase